jgi:CDP-diglyceride synthetase
MSSLGNSSYNPNGATIYNSSVIISGLLFIVFFIGLYQWQDNKKSNKTLLYATQIVGFLLSITIILTGIYSEDFQTQHIFWSIIAGIMGFLVNVFIAYYLFRQKESIAKMNYSIFGLMGFYIIMLFILSPQHVLTEWIVRISGDINLILMIFNLKHVFRVRFLTHQN